MSRRTKTAIAVAVTVVVLAAGVLVMARTGVARAREFEAAARAGKTHAEAGARALASRDATQAAERFARASQEFERADALLGPAWVERASRGIAPLGRQYAAAKALVAIGLDVSVAGEELAVAFADDGSAKGGKAAADADGSVLATGRTHLLTALGKLADASERASALSDRGLVGPLAEQVRALKRLMGSNASLLSRMRALSVLAHRLLPTEQRILLVSQNSAELRPTGGFIGSYGILTIGPDGVELASYKDVYSLPNPPGRVPMPPGARMTRDFQFRDANWWIDFPTSARAMLDFWAEMGQPPVDGVIAVDVVAMQDILEVLGPVEVPGYSEEFSRENLVERLTYLLEVKYAGVAGRKDVLVALANEVERRVLSSRAQEVTKLLRAAAKAADEKHVQAYFIDPDAQKAVTELGWSGSIAAPARTTDVVAVSNAMTKPSKANFAVRKQTAYDVALRPDGSADTTLTLRYHNTGKLAVEEAGIFRNYLRVYRAPGTLAAAGDQTSEDASGYADVDLPKVIREFSLPQKEKASEVLVARVPRAWRAGSQQDGGAHYRLFMVRQADLEDVPTTVRVAAPAGWRIATARAVKAASRETLPLDVGETSAELRVPLTADLVLDVELERD